MEFFSQKTQIPFMQIKTKAFMLSVGLLLASCFSVWQYGLCLSHDFTGGNMLTLAFPDSVDADSIRSRLPQSKHQAAVQMLGGSNAVLIKLPLESDNPNLMPDHIVSLFPEAKLTHKAFVGPQVGEELLLNGINCKKNKKICII